MYIQYISTFHKLEECYDQVVHPQKRRLIRHVLDGTMGRYTCSIISRSLLIFMTVWVCEQDPT